MLIVRKRSLSLVHPVFVTCVSDDDGGRLLSEAEYEEYKRNVATPRLQHRLYVSWRHSSTGMDCRQVGPASKCFCRHSFRQHNSDAYDTRQVRCQAKGCPCPLFAYLPIRGSEDVKCSQCKHSYDTHHPASHLCTALPGRPGARALLPATSSSSSRTSIALSTCACPGFRTSNCCSCKAPWAEHTTVFESREERLAGGRAVDGGQGTLYKGMGGLTGFTSLVDGVDLAQVPGYRARVMGRGGGDGRELGGSGGAALQLVAGDEEKTRELRRGKMQEADEMALYERSYHGSRVSSQPTHQLPLVSLPLLM